MGKPIKSIVGFFKKWSQEAFNPDEAFLHQPEVCAFCGGPITLLDKDSAGCRNEECPIYGVDVWEVEKSGDIIQKLGTSEVPKGTIYSGGSRQKYSYIPEHYKVSPEEASSKLLTSGIEDNRSILEDWS